MEKRFLAGLLSLVMIFSLLPVAALAADTTTHIYTVSTAQEFVDAVTAINAASGGSYVISLQDDIDLSGQTVNFTNNTTTILGNGHTLTTYNFAIKGSATVNLGKKDGRNILTIKCSYSDKPIVYAVDSGKLNIYDGVTLCDHTPSFGSPGGIQLNNEAECHMYGGTITNCGDQSSFPVGGVLVDDSAEFYMHGGTISECVGYVGGVLVDSGASFEMTGGKITGCTGSMYSGGVVIFPDASFEMTGGKITGCTGIYGGGILTFSAKNTITDGEISGNKAEYNGEISDCEGSGGGILIYDGEAEISNGIKLYANSALSGDDIFLFKDKGRVELKLGDVPENLYLPDDPQMIDGWYKDDGPRWKPGDEKVDISNPFTATIGLKAAHGLPQYTVTYDANGGDGATTDEHSPYDSNADVTVLPNRFTKDDYQFTGWNTAADGSGIFYQPNATFSITTDTTLYAQWVKAYTVTYNLDGGQGAEGADYTEKTVKENTEVTLAAAPTKSGYKFIGWSDDINADTHLPGDELTVTSDITLTAQWRKTGGGTTTYYTLHYESNGGTAYKNEQYAANTTVQLDKVPVREGYRFTGWYRDKELTEQISSIKMTGNQTVYAGWRKSTVPDTLNGSDHFAYVIGYPNGSVRPQGDITRAEVATIFFRLLKPEVRDGNLCSVNSFADVNEGIWYNKAVSTMAALGIIKGRSSESFDPDAPITRAEFSAICARFDTGMTEGDSNFTDISGHWAEAEIERAVALGWITGYPDFSFRPDSCITRAEAMSIINRVLCRIPEDENDLLPGMNVWSDNQPGAWYYLAVQEATNSHDFRYKGEIYEDWTELTADPDWTKYQD